MSMLRAIVTGVVVLTLTGCQFISPGVYDAAMTIRRDGSFTYRYTGEIQLLTQLTMFQKMAAKEAAEREAETFDPGEQVCWTEETSGGESDVRTCTDEEIADKRIEWEAARVAKREEEKKTLEMMKAMFGGIDPSDPEAMTIFAKRLQMHKGWKKVAYNGTTGIFDVDYEISGQIDRDFVFPLFEGVNIMVPFVQAARRTDGKVRVTAPAFVTSKEGETTGAVMNIAMAELAKDGANFMKQPNGTFTLTTDADILTNNTREGPAAKAGMKTLSWTTGRFDNKVPEALIAL